MLDLSARKVYGALAEQCVGGDAKADKVENATSGHLAGLDSNGNLTDSGVKPTEEVTVEGNPITFDSPFEQDAKSVVVTVKPIQDLHGLPFPYVGGASANVLNPYDGAGERNSVTWTPIVDTGNNKLGFTVNGVASTHTPVIPFSLPIVNAEKTYNIQYFDFDSPQGVAKFGWDSTAEAQLANVDSGTIIVPANHEVYIGIYINPNQAISNIKLQVMVSESVITTFAPYSNICPISGIDEVEIEVSGKNCLPLTLAHLKAINLSGSWNGDTYTYGNMTYKVNVDNAGKVVSILANGSRTVGETVALYLASDESITINDSVIISGTLSINALKADDSWSVSESVPYTTSNITEFQSLWTSPAEGVTVNNVTLYPMLRLSSVSDPTFEPYKGEPTTTTIPLPSTLYDADVDVTEGSGTNNGGFAEFDGSEDENWAEGLVEGAYSLPKSVITNAYIPRSSHDFITDKFKVADQNTFVLGTIWAGGDYLNVVIKNMFPTLTEFKNYLASNPLQIEYPLNVPPTLSIDPTILELLEGTNVVSTNGEKVAVTYGRSLWQDINDLKTDTDGKLNKSDVATIEGDTASKAYSVNDFMLRADGLYKVTAPIAQNASITSSNTTKTTIGAVLTALLNS